MLQSRCGDQAHRPVVLSPDCALGHPAAFQTPGALTIPQTNCSKSPGKGIWASVLFEVAQLTALHSLGWEVLLGASICGQVHRTAQEFSRVGWEGMDCIQILTRHFWEGQPACLR